MIDSFFTMAPFCVRGQQNTEQRQQKKTLQACCCVSVYCKWRDLQPWGTVRHRETRRSRKNKREVTSNSVWPWDRETSNCLGSLFLFDACTNLKRKACDCFCAPYLCHRLMRLLDFTLRPQRKINKEPQRTKERIESLMVSWNFETIFYNIVWSFWMHVTVCAQ